jgi:hypothetical protein
MGYENRRIGDNKTIRWETRKGGYETKLSGDETQVRWMSERKICDKMEDKNKRLGDK